MKKQNISLSIFLTCLTVIGLIIFLSSILYSLNTIPDNIANEIGDKILKGYKPKFGVTLVPIFLYLLIWGLTGILIAVFIVSSSFLAVADENYSINKRYFIISLPAGMFCSICLWILVLRWRLINHIAWGWLIPSSFIMFVIITFSLIIIAEIFEDFLKDTCPWPSYITTIIAVFLGIFTLLF